MSVKSILVETPVQLIHVITPRFRQEVIRQLEAQVDSINQRLTEMEERAKPILTQLHKENFAHGMAARDQLNQEKKGLIELRDGVLREIDRIKSLPDGAEVPQGQLTGITVLCVGDTLISRLNESALVLKDGEIVEIRGMDWSELPIGE